MPSKIKPIPLRLPEALKAEVAAYAETHKIKSQHAAILDIIRVGLWKPAPVAEPAPKAQRKPSGNRIIPAAEAFAPTPAPERTSSPLDTSMVPELGSFERKPMQKATPASKRKWT